MIHVKLTQNVGNWLTGTELGFIDLTHADAVLGAGTYVQTYPVTPPTQAELDAASAAAITYNTAHRYILGSEFDPIVPGAGQIVVGGANGPVKRWTPAASLGLRPRLIPPVTGTPPTVTFGTTFGTPTIASARTVPMTDPSVRALSDFGNYNFASGTYTYYGCHSDQPDGAMNIEPTVIEFMTDADAIELNMFGVGEFNLLVDGQWASASMLAAGKVNGDRYFTKIAFPDSRPRQITLIGLTQLADLRIGPTYSVWSPTEPKGGRIAFVMDSYGQKLSTKTRGGIAVHAGLALGYRDIRISASGGTGYLNNNTNYQTFRSRYAADVVAIKPDLVVLMGGINDQGRQAKTVFKAEVQTLFGQHSTQLPGVPLIVFGPWSPNSTTNTQQSYLDIRDALSESMAGLTTPWVFVDTLTSNVTASSGYTKTSPQPWIGGTGKSGSPIGDGNADIYIDTDGTHPTPTGVEYLAMRTAAAISAALATL